jgi:hypothetical protein
MACTLPAEEVPAALEMRLFVLIFIKELNPELEIPLINC